MNQRQEGSTEFLIPRGNAAELLKLVEEPLHLLAPLVLFRVIGQRLSAIHPWGNDRLNPQLPQKGTDGLTVIGLVHHRHLQPRYCRRQCLPHGLEAHRVVALAPTQHERDTGAVVGAGYMQLGGQTPPRATQSLGGLAAVLLGAPAAC